MTLGLIGAIAMVVPALVFLFFFKDNYFRTLSLLALLYPIGEWLQYKMIGPRWIRWHLSDVGFVPDFGLVVAAYLLCCSRAREKFQAMQRLELLSDSR